MLQVGQELWYVPADSRHHDRSHAVTVVKVGRKWAHLNSYYGKIDIETLWLDGGKYSSPGRCWASKEAWEAEQHRHRVWYDFQRRLTHTPPDGVTVDTIEKIKSMLDPSGQQGDGK